MNILHIIPSLGSGGAERMLSKIVSEDRENVHTIIYYKDSKIVYDFSHADIFYFNYKSIKSVCKLSLKLITKKYHIVNSWMRANTFGLLYKLLFNQSKVIFNIRHDFPEQINLSSILERFVVFQSRFVNGSIFVSYSAYKNYISKGFDNNNSIVITNGFKINEENLYKKYYKDKKIIGYVGRFHPVKNQKRMLQIFNEMSRLDKSLELWLIGANLNQLPLEKYIENPNKIRILGETKNLHEIYSSINLLLLTSQKEGFPNVIGEAMSYGVPVATTEAGDSFSIIENSGIKINKNETAVDTAKSISNLLSNQHEIDFSSKESIRIVEEKYNIEKIIENYKNYYRQIEEI